MYLRPGNFYTKNRFNLYNGETVVEVRTAERKVITAAGNKFTYDRLLVASGSSPKIPDIPGIQAKGVFGLRTLEHAKGIMDYTAPGKRAVVIGGGFVSLKAAYALLKAGMSVTAVISSGQILSQMLDKPAADLVANVLTTKGMVIKYHTDVKQVVTHGDTVSAVELTSGEQQPADLVIVGKGVTPNTGFLTDSGIRVDRGIVVDEYLQTTIPGVYAAGDVAQGYDIVSGEQRINAIWPNATEQGAIAGKNMTGARLAYSGSIGMNSADFFGLSTIAAGAAKATGNGYEVAEIHPGGDLYRRLVFKQDLLVGFIMVGNTQKAGILTTLIKEKVPLGPAKAELARGVFRQKALW